MKSPAVVGRAIAKSVPAWRHVEWFLAPKVMETKSIVVLGNSTQQRTVTVAGQIKALAKIFDGQLDGGLTFSGLSSTDLSIRGASGAVAMRLARVRTNGDLEFK